MTPCTRWPPLTPAPERAGHPWLLAIDLGTGGPKTGAVGLDGRVMACHWTPVQTRHLPDGGSIQDPREWWEGIRAGVRAILAGGSVKSRDLQGVGITGQWGSTVPLDAGGEPAGPCLLWSDGRGGPYSAKAMGGPLSLFGFSPGNLLAWLRLTGGAPSPQGADPLGHELYLKHRQPDLYRRTATLMEPLDYLGYLLTGRQAATPASMILSWLTDNRPGAEPAYHPALLARAGRDRSRLPELLPTGSVLGTLAPKVADDLGLPAAPVVCGIPDLHTAFVGSGAVAPYQAHLTISTTAWISCEVPFKKTDVLHQVASVPGLRPGAYLVADNHETAGLCLQWLRDSVLGGSYEELTALAATAPAGSGGVLFAPWLKGERTPVDDRNLRGAFLNLSMISGRAAMARSVLEGVAFNARWMLDVVDAFAGRRLDPLRILGGGAVSDLWCQVHADILERRIERVADPTSANLRGAAMFAAISLGKLRLDDVGGLVAVERSFEPEPEAVAACRPLYAEFKRLYGSLHGIYARLNRGSAAGG